MDGSVTVGLNTNFSATPSATAMRSVNVPEVWHAATRGDRLPLSTL